MVLVKNVISFVKKKTSEFGIYGSGVSNYFKFLKWCIGVMFVLSLISMPILLLNIYGPAEKSSENQGISSLSLLSLGHLMRSSADGTDTLGIKVPLCEQFQDFGYIGEFHSSNSYDKCYLSREELGLFYQYIDIFLCFTLFICYLWLKYFEEQEILILDKNTVFASMYTVQLKIFLRMQRNQILQNIFKIVLV